jgi:hypothetical protein
VEASPNKKTEKSAIMRPPSASGGEGKARVRPLSPPARGEGGGRGAEFT